MTPMNSETLFNAEPKLFAYELPTREERRRIAPGDLVKLFFQLEGFSYPKPIWITVNSVDDTDEYRYTGVLADMKYGPTIKSHFMEPVRFSICHLYRVPLDRPEVENKKFNAETRT